MEVLETEKGGNGGDGSLSCEEIDKMKYLNLCAALKKRRLRWTGIKVNLVKRLKNPASTDTPDRQLLVEEPADPILLDEALQ